VVAIAAATIVIAAAGVVIAVDITLLPSRHGCHPIALLLLPCHCITTTVVLGCAWTGCAGIHTRWMLN